MPLSENEKEYVVNKVVEILRSSDKKMKIEELREKVMNEIAQDDQIHLDDTIYSVIQAIEELYGQT